MFLASFDDELAKLAGVADMADTVYSRWKSSGSGGLRTYGPHTMPKIPKKYQPKPEAKFKLPKHPPAKPTEWQLEGKAYNKYLDNKKSGGKEWLAEGRAYEKMRASRPTLQAPKPGVGGAVAVTPAKAPKPLTGFKPMVLKRR